jgi:rieske iron-sulfur protein
MKSKFSQERRDVLKSTCTLVGAAAFVSVGGSLNAYAAEQAKGVPQPGDVLVFADGTNKGKEVKEADVVAGAKPVTAIAQNPSTGKLEEDDGDSSNATVLLFKPASGSYSEDVSDATVDGISCYSAVCPHLGCMLTDWKEPQNWFMCPCHDATFDPLKAGANTGGATSRDLANIPIKSVDGKLVVADKPSGYIGVKRG